MVRWRCVCWMSLSRKRLSSCWPQPHCQHVNGLLLDPSSLLITCVLFPQNLHRKSPPFCWINKLKKVGLWVTTVRWWREAEYQRTWTYNSSSIVLSTTVHQWAVMSSFKIYFWSLFFYSSHPYHPIQTPVYPNLIYYFISLFATPGLPFMKK